MHMTTDANETMKLSDIISGHRTRLVELIEQAEASQDSEKDQLVATLKGKLQKLDDQAAAVSQGEA